MDKGTRAVEIDPDKAAIDGKQVGRARIAVEDAFQVQRGERGE